MNDALLWNEIGNLYLKLDLFDDAISVYLKSIELNPDSGWTYSNLAFSYFKKGEYGRALSLYRISIPLLDNSKYLAITWNRLGDVFRALKDADNAIIAYKKSDDLEIGTSLTSVLANKQRSSNDKVPPQAPPPQQVRVSSNANRNPNEANRSVPLANQNSNRQAFVNPAQTKDPKYLPGTRPAENIFRPNPRPINSEHNRPPIHPLDPKQIAASNDGMGRSADGISAASNYSIKKPNLVVIPAPEVDQTVRFENPEEVTSELITQPMKYGEGPQAIPQDTRTDSTESTPSQQPSEKMTHSMNGNVNLEETLAKVHIYENITQANPNNDRAWDTLGKLYKSLGRYEDAINAYKQAIEKVPSREVYYYYLGLLYSVVKEDEEAAWAFENVLKLNPDYVLAHSALAGIYRRLGFESKANDHISIALPRMDNESSYNLACFYAICGEADKAMDYLQLALKNKDTTIEWIKSDPDLELLHNDQRYQGLIQEVDNENSQRRSGNFFSSSVDGSNNKLLPMLNNSLSR